MKRACWRCWTKSIIELRSELLALKGDDFWSRFGRWFFMRAPERTISPDSQVTVGELPPVVFIVAAHRNRSFSASKSGIS